MELSKKERLFLYNQYEILKILNADDADMVKTYEKNQKILLNGFKYNYDDFVTWVMDDISEDISNFVWDVLQMYSVIMDSYSTLDEEHQHLINERRIKFQGFDGNEESDYYLYANFVLRFSFTVRGKVAVSTISIFFTSPTS